MDNKKYLDKKLSLSVRKNHYKDTMTKLLNPLPAKDFDPDNFEPIGTPEEKEVAYRKRVKPGKMSPTFGLKPKEIMEGQLIGMFETKQDIYLHFAHRCNDLQAEIDELRGILKKAGLA